MSEHTAKISWSRGSRDFSYDTYSRDHTWTFGAGVQLQASAAPDYMGSAEKVDPEEAFVAALSSCHMLTFLAIAARKHLIVDSYVDAAVGYLEKDDEGTLCVTRVVLRPKVSFAAQSSPSASALEKLHQQAHEHCFIANSVRSSVTIESA